MIAKVLSKMIGRRRKTNRNRSASVAKERLQIIVAHQRGEREQPDYLPQMQQEILHALDRADADDNVRAIIFTGAGRGYCAGADLSAGGNTFNNDAPGRTGGLRRDGGGILTLRLFESLKPIISACNGPAVGVGVTMQCAMDVRLASEDARYGFVFSKRPLQYGKTENVSDKKERINRMTERRASKR